MGYSYTSNQEQAKKDLNKILLDTTRSVTDREGHNKQLLSKDKKPKKLLFKTLLGIRELD